MRNHYGDDVRERLWGRVNDRTSSFVWSGVQNSFWLRVDNHIHRRVQIQVGNLVFDHVNGFLWDLR